MCNELCRTIKYPEIILHSTIKGRIGILANPPFFAFCRIQGYRIQKKEDAKADTLVVAKSSS